MSRCCAGESLDIFGEKSARRALGRYLRKGLGGSDAPRIADWAAEQGLDGATLSQVDREQLFYLMARGLPRSDAERLIVRGFFQDVLDRIDLDPVREALGAALEARIPEG